MQVYTSPLPARAYPAESLFTFLFRTHFADHAPTAAAFIDAPSGAVLTRGELRDLSLEFAHGLRHAFARAGGVRLRRGDTVLVLAPNCLAFPVAMAAVFAAGLCLAPASPALTPRELAAQWADCRAAAVLVHPDAVPHVLQMFALLDVDLGAARRRIVVMDWLPGAPRKGPSDFVCMSDLLGKGTSEEEKFTGEQVDETVILCYSSGTTGKPKGVETTHKSLVSSLTSNSACYPTLRSAAPKALGFVPFYHIFGMVQVQLAEFFRGVPVVVMPGFEPTAFCQYVERYRVTHVCVVPPVLLTLLHHPALAQYDVRSLEYMMSGAAPLSLSLLKALAARLTGLGANVSIIQGYGLTESMGFYQPLRDWLRKAGTIGLLMPHLKARLVADDGADVQAGAPGELWLRGPCMFKGYLRNADATRAALTPDGWFKTGDVLTRDEEGYFRVVDRKKELIKYKGYQVAPAELESVLLEHPDIVDAGVVGIVSEAEATELPRAYVVHATKLAPADRNAFARSVQEWIKERVANHKRLRGGVIVVDAIPKSPSGKILRRTLRDLAQAEASTQSSTTGSHHSKAKL
ncbi:acyl--CoA ligase [Phanerochaete sordida]|uniref:Acyl--CoA ligase n=1 Tax=Phanerochaete sordida TaxID=48140 RepID=A0A9P3LGK3_9APHY|nr:acyl--CoA ligase [Phanerochaete sordida]